MTNEPDSHMNEQDAEQYADAWLSDADHGIRICEHGWD